MYIAKNYEKHKIIPQSIAKDIQLGKNPLEQNFMYQKMIFGKLFYDIASEYSSVAIDCMEIKNFQKILIIS